MPITDKDQTMQFGTHPAGQAWHEISGEYAPSPEPPHETPALDDFVAPTTGQTATTPTIKGRFSPADTKAIDPAKPTVLLIDDDEDIRAIYAEIFARAGYNIEQAHDGLAGLDRIKKFQPDLIWTGIVMPRMDGYTLIETLKKNTALAEIPVIVCSHKGDMKDRSRMQGLGVSDFILHGYVSPEEVVDRAHALLTTHEEYTIPLDPYDAETQRLVAAHAREITCPDGQRLALRMRDEASRGLSAQFVCVSE